MLHSSCSSLFDDEPHGIPSLGGSSGMTTRLSGVLLPCLVVDPIEPLPPPAPNLWRTRETTALSTSSRFRFHPYGGTKLSCSTDRPSTSPFHRPASTTSARLCQASPPGFVANPFEPLPPPAPNLCRINPPLSENGCACVKGNLGGCQLECHVGSTQREPERPHGPLSIHTVD
jgi:hypothetical protein